MCLPLAPAGGRLLAGLGLGLVLEYGLALDGGLETLALEGFDVHRGLGAVRLAARERQRMVRRTRPRPRLRLRWRIQ